MSRISWTGVGMLAAAAALLALALVWRLSREADRQISALPPATLRDTGGPLTLAAVGDSVIDGPLPAAGADRGFDQVAALLHRASAAMTNLEEELGPTGEAHPPDAWPAGAADVAFDLRRLGITIVTRANNHGADRGADGILSTGAALDRAGLRHAGAGRDLDAAREPAVLGDRPRRIAVIAVATSVDDEARATRTRGDIVGRAGVSSIRTHTDITADPATYAALLSMAQATHTGSESGSGLQLSGRLIRKGDRTSVEITADREDLDDVLDRVRRAHADADVVVVSLHSHEPGNLSVAPAAFVRAFARQAIDSGASLVVGHGPRQLRGIEVYGRGVILYSLGNFIFDRAAIPQNGADVYDANTDLDALALDAVGRSGPPVLPAYDEAVWWESVVATATFGDRGVVRVDLTPIDLGTERPRGGRGRPRPASAERAAEILGRLAEQSKEHGTRIRIENGVGEVDIGTPAAAGS